MKECELCNSPARMFCESDQASLCWECDSKVHSANFLVARHPRNLLCHVCQTATPWQASGSKLGPTVSVCERCMKRCNDRKQQPEESHGGNDDDEDDDDHGDEDDDDGEDEDTIDNNDDDDEDDDDIQVVPWLSSSSNPPPVASSSSSEDTTSRFHGVLGSASGGCVDTRSENNISLKRSRGDLSSQEDVSSQQTGTVNSLSNNRKRSISMIQSSQIEKKSAVIVKSIKQLEKKLISGNGNYSKTILEMCKLSEDR
ncbi:hypothetical protein ACHQM5_003884 [Ranunculus cassubicifolius]